MILNLSDVLSEQRQSIQSVPIEITSFKSEMGTYNIRHDTTWLSGKYAGERSCGYEQKAEITTVAPCDRCLDDVEVKVKLEFEHKITTDAEGRRSSQKN